MKNADRASACTDRLSNGKEDVTLKAGVASCHRAAAENNTPSAEPSTASV